MKDKEWHRDRIKELEFQIKLKREDDQRNLFVFGALLSATLILFIFELQKEIKNLLWIVIFGLLIFVSLWGVIKEPSRIDKEKTQIKYNYDALLGR